MNIKKKDDRNDSKTAMPEMSISWHEGDKYYVLIGLDGKPHYYPSWIIEVLRISHRHGVRNGRSTIFELDKKSGLVRILPGAKTALKAIMDLPYLLASANSLNDLAHLCIKVRHVLESGCDTFLPYYPVDEQGESSSQDNLEAREESGECGIAQGDGPTVH